MDTEREKWGGGFNHVRCREKMRVRKLKKKKKRKKGGARIKIEKF